VSSAPRASAAFGGASGGGRKSPTRGTAGGADRMPRLKYRGRSSKGCYMKREDSRADFQELPQESQLIEAEKILVALAEAIGRRRGVADLIRAAKERMQSDE